MNVFKITIIGAALALSACSGGQGEKSGELQKAGGELASCTGGDVPVGATNCLLNLETGEDTYWSDTDGVDPSTAGCHYEFEDDACGAFKEGRTFGEFCLDGDRLVESNPGAGECHTHKGDLGKPAVVSCSAWCLEQGNSDGSCQGGVMADGAHGSCESAQCVCG